MTKEHSYGQRVKAEVRSRLLTSAVSLLTSRRSRASVINPRHVEVTMQHALDLLKNPRIAREAQLELEEWTSLHRRLLGRKQPRDLRVLFLCGPEPMNDLNVLLAEGIDPHNVWAVESDKHEFQRAVTQLLGSDLPIKIYPGKLAEFLEFNGEVFDIIYVDGCAPFGLGKPNSLGVLLQIFKSQRLSPLGALVTTYAELPDPLPDWYVNVLSAYFRFRYNDVPGVMFDHGLDPAECEHDDGSLRNELRDNHEPYYSDFITRFIADLARSIVPNCRAFAFSGFSSAYLANSQKQNAAIKFALRTPPYKAEMSIHDLVYELGDFRTNPGGYPVMSFLRVLSEESKESPFWNQLSQSKLGNISLLKGAQFAALLENCIEGHWDAMGEVLFDAIRLGWFDRSVHFSCDVPLPNLKVNSFLGIHGAPSFPNPSVSQRFRYTAKQTTMYSDLIVLDKCRSYFDWFPTAHVAKARFESSGFQLVARCIMDRIGWADWHARSHPFSGAAVAGMGDTKYAKAVTFGPRETLH